MAFRKFLVRIRREYHQNPKRLFIGSFLSTLIFVGLGLLADAFLPFESFGNVVRSIVLIPTSISMFVLGYAISLFMHYARVSSDPNWTPYRLRLSPSWRRRVSAVVGAMMFVVIYANGFRVGYTPTSSVAVAIAIALFAFMRTTKEEAAREQFDIPDVRDVKYNSHMKKLASQRIEDEQERRNKRDARKDRLMGRKPQEDDDE